MAVKEPTSTKSDTQMTFVILMSVVNIIWSLYFTNTAHNSKLAEMRHQVAINDVRLADCLTQYHLEIVSKGKHKPTSFCSDLRRR